MSDVESIDFQPADLADQSPEEAVGALLDYARDLNASDLFLCTNEQEVVASVRHLGIIRLVTRPKTTVADEFSNCIVDAFKE